MLPINDLLNYLGSIVGAGPQNIDERVTRICTKLIKVNPCTESMWNFRDCINIRLQIYDLNTVCGVIKSLLVCRIDIPGYTLFLHFITQKEMLTE